MSNITLNPKITLGFVDYRDEIWGDSYNWVSNRSSNLVKWLVIHHSAGPHDATPDNIASGHKARGWDGVGYHFIIDQKGVVYYVGDIGTSRANVLDKNDFVIGVCMIGDFTQYLPSDAQIRSAHELCKFILFDLKGQFPNLKGWDSLVGHKDLQATACPGSSWEDPVGGIRTRIVNNIAYTPSQAPPTTTPTPTPPATNPTVDLSTLYKRLEDLETLLKQTVEDLKTTQLSTKTISDLLKKLGDVFS